MRKRLDFVRGWNFGSEFIVGQNSGRTILGRQKIYYVTWQWEADHVILAICSLKCSVASELIVLTI